MCLYDSKTDVKFCAQVKKAALQYASCSFRGKSLDSTKRILSFIFVERAELDSFIDDLDCSIAESYAVYIN